MRAFEAATRLGFRYLETDVHVTVDGVLVAFHDDQLDRVTDRSGLVADLRWEQVSAARIAGSEPIPTLDELLEAFPDSRFNIDMKTEDTVVPLVAAVRRHGATDRVCIASFSDSRLQRARALLGPTVCSAAGPREIAKLSGSSRLPGATWLRTGAVRRFQCLQVPVRHRNFEIVTPALIEAAHSRGCQVQVWTIDDPVEMERLLDMGVDGIMTDRPSVLRSVIERRGSWA